MSFERLHGWHNALFEYIQGKTYKIKRAKFRDDEMSVISAPSKNVQIHYEALPAERVEGEKFFKFYQQKSRKHLCKKCLSTPLVCDHPSL